MAGVFDEQADFERLKRHESLREKAVAAVGGNRGWKTWKIAALDEILEMLRRARRVELLHADLHGDFDLTYKIAMPVPRQPCEGRLVICQSGGPGGGRRVTRLERDSFDVVRRDLEGEEKMPFMPGIKNGHRFRMSSFSSL